MKLNELLNLKTLIILGAVLVLIGVTTTVDFSGLQKGSIIPQAVTIQNINGVDYAIVSMDGYNYGETDIGTEKTSSTAHYDVDGNTNSKNQTIEGDFDAVIKLKVLNTGWRMKTKAYETAPFVNKVWAEECGWFNEKTCTRTEAPNPITYYHVTDDMQPLAEYEVWAIVNGKEQPHVTVTPKNTQQTIELPGTDPVIYWRETSYGLDGTSIIPTGVEDVDILRKDATGNVLFADRNQVSIAVSFWNAVFLESVSLLERKYETDEWVFAEDGIKLEPVYYVEFEDHIGQRVDITGNKEYDIKKSAPPAEFTLNDLYHNKCNFRCCDGAGCFLSTPYWFDMPSLDVAPYANDKNTDGYTLSGDGEFLRRDGRITISGTFQIPLEYGDVKIVTREPIPEIVSTSEPFEVFDGGFKEVTVSVKNKGETGHILVIPTLEEGGTGSVFLPDAQNVLIPAGDTVDVVFKFDSCNIGVGEVTFYANAGTHQDSVTLAFEIKEPAPGAELRFVRIVAINKEDGSELESIYPGKFPITVDQNAVTKYGIWEGQLWDGSPTVSGQTIVIDEITWYPEDDKTIVIEEDDQTFTFKYSTDKENGDGIGFIWYILGGVIFGILILGAYMYASEKELFRKR